MNYHWNHGMDGTSWSGPFGSREEAVAAAEAELEPGQSFCVAAEGDPIDLVSFDLSDLLEMVACSVFDQGGDNPDNWPSCGASDAARKLAEDVTALVVAYLREHDAPAFWVAAHGSDHVVPYPKGGES